MTDNPTDPAFIQSYALRHALDEHAATAHPSGLLWALLPAREAGRNEGTKEDKEKEDE